MCLHACLVKHTHDWFMHLQVTRKNKGLFWEYDATIYCSVCVIATVLRYLLLLKT